MNNFNPTVSCIKLIPLFFIIRDSVADKSSVREENNRFDGRRDRWFLDYKSKMEILKGSADWKLSI